MRTRKLTLERGAAALALATLGLAGSQAFAAEYWLRAAATTVEMPNPSGSGTIIVPMWGYASCTAAFASCSGPVTVPGPALTVPPGDTTLTVNLRNDLTVSTSLVINGLIKPMAPVLFEPSSPNTTYSSRPAGNTTARVRSFDAEAAALGGTYKYEWGPTQTNPTASAVKAGTYLYQSGTQPQVQVQMGLYGAVTKNAVDVVTGTSPVRGQAYAASTAQPAAAFEYDNQVTLLYSEIDPALHKAVAENKYGVACLPTDPPDCANPTSTFSYAPKYFLINGRPYPDGSLIMTPAGNPGRTLLRMLNAGLTTHVPMIQGAYWSLVAEDGKPYSYRRAQYTALLPAGKTADLLLTPDSGGGNYAIMDRRLSLSNAGWSDGGMLAVLQYAALGAEGPVGPSDPNLPPIATADSYDSIVGVALNVGAIDGVLKNDDDTDHLPLPMKAVAAGGPTTLGGNYILNSNGSFTYTPPASATSATVDTFSYQITDSKAVSAAATVTINLAVPTAPTLAGLDTFDRTDSTSLGSNWSQIAASAQSFPDIQIVGNQATAVSTDLGGLAIWSSASFGPTQGAGFRSPTPLINAGLVLKATGGTPAAPANYVRVRCEANNSGEVVIATMMGGSNVSVFVKQAAFASAGCGAGGSLSAVVDAKGLVTAFLNGNFVGGVQLPDVGAWKGNGNIGIQLQTKDGIVDGFRGGSL